MGIESQPLMHDADVEEDKSDSPPHRRNKRPERKIAALAAVTAISLLSNIVLVIFLLSQQSTNGGKSAYAGLTWSTTGSWTPESKYYDKHHKTQSDLNWKLIDWNSGMITISDDEAKKWNLPRSQRFPWDETKGIYLINAYHNLHCLQWLWISLAKFREGGKFGMEDWHGFHCLDQLRQDTICYADDTPRYGGEDQANESGSNQNRQCRDWNKLQRWAENRSACYRYLNESVPHAIDNYKFCPPGNPYKTKVEELYGPNEAQRLMELYGNVAA